MSDDIVTRLMAIATEEHPLWRSQMVEAANEIERLRNALEQCEAERDTWRDAYRQYQ